jgi:hypothetical protein
MPSQGDTAKQRNAPVHNAKQTTARHTHLAWGMRHTKKPRTRTSKTYDAKKTQQKARGVTSEYAIPLKNAQFYHLFDIL